jgi:hypothetical protein
MMVQEIPKPLRDHRGFLIFFSEPVNETTIDCCVCGSGWNHLTGMCIWHTYQSQNNDLLE